MQVFQNGTGLYTTVFPSGKQRTHTHIHTHIYTYVHIILNDLLFIIVFVIFLKRK